jgi:hypothetical protein
VVSIDEPQAGGAWGGVAAAPVFSAIAQQTMRFLRVPPEGSRTPSLEGLHVKREQPSASRMTVTLSVGNFVENLREMLREMIDQLRSYVWGQFLSIDPKDTRKPRKKTEKLDR